MGVFTTLLTNPVNFDSSANAVATNRQVTMEFEELKNLSDPAITSKYNEVDSVWTLTTFNGTVSGGNYTISVTTADGESFTTANIIWNANASTIEGLINTAATGNVTGWANGDISVTGGDMATANVVLTFDGDSVDGSRQQACTIADVDLTGGGTVTDTFETTAGQSVRNAFACLEAIGIITGNIPEQRAVTPITIGNTALGLVPPWAICEEAKRILAKECATEDNHGPLEGALLAAMGLANPQV